MADHSNTLAGEPDGVLFQQSLDGDRDSFSALVERYQNLTCSVAYGISGDLPQSEDIAQEAFIVAWKKRKTLAEHSRFKSWLCGIARNLALKSVRAKSSEGRVKKELALRNRELEEVANKSQLSDEEKQLLWKTLEEIPETYREPLILFYREEKSVAKVAEQLDLSEEVVKTRLSRGRKMIRGKVERLMEEVLLLTRPGPAFTVGVMAALPAALATSASAATVASGVGKGAVGLGSGAMLGAFGGFMGGYLGYRFGAATARYPEQRVLMRNSFIGSLIFTLIFVIPFVFGSPFGFKDMSGLFTLFWCFGFVLLVVSWNRFIGKKSREVAAKLKAEGREELEKTKLRHFLGKWEGRKWESKTCFLGWPLISIAFGSPDRDFSGYTHDNAGLEANKLKTAKGWIAMGDRAYGLIAIGNIAVGGLAMGAVTLGLISFGGIAAGGIALGGVTLAGLSMGGLALGVGALGGCAAGWWSFGGSSFGWESAKGGSAIARDFAVGGYARATEANTEAAKAYFESHWFYDIGEVYLSLMVSPAAMPVMWAVIIAMSAGVLCVGFKRKREGSSTGL